MKHLIVLVLSLLLGSIPFGVLIATIKGVDLKKVGSGNIGATNVLRTMGKGPAFFTLTGDILKGSLAVIIARYFLRDPVMEGIAGLVAILGHNFSPFLGFRGGKGVATSIGVLLVYTPLAGIATVLIWLLVIFITRYSSLGALVSFAVLPLTMRILHYGKEHIIIGLVMSALLIARHTDNIRRLMKGTESALGKRS